MLMLNENVCSPIFIPLFTIRDGSNDLVHAVGQR